jgi:hypothetical protein
LTKIFHAAEPDNFLNIRKQRVINKAAWRLAWNLPVRDHPAVTASRAELRAPRCSKAERSRAKNILFQFLSDVREVSLVVEEFKERIETDESVDLG